MYKITIANKETTIYADVLEPEALNQFKSAMEQDFTVKGALMADAHFGYSLPIGGVVATKDVILPSWVGYDIGCGMAAVKIVGENYKSIIQENAKEIFNQINRDIPMGSDHHEREQEWDYEKDNISEELKQRFKGIVNNKFTRSGFKQLGTLGGGNHFIEIGYNDTGDISIIVHSGSRGVGWQTARRYMCLASNSEKPKEGHFGLEVTSDLGISYINDMNFCLNFALENRKHMIRQVLNILSKYIDVNTLDNPLENLINRNHNHAELNKEGLWIHRKGATHAEKGMIGVIPGNMRDGAFIVEGKGNPDSLQSSSHGAGRVMSRKKAKANIKLEDFQLTMKGIQARVKPDTIDESPYAYKIIFEVMELQKDLVEVIAYYKPIINIKG